MPRPSPDRVIQDWTFAILPVAAGFVLVILTVVALVYSIGVKTAIPEGLAIAFAGLAYGIFGLWMGGHLVRYCRGYYTRGSVAAPATPVPLPLTGISTGEDGATMAAGASIVLPISYQQPQQQSRQDRLDHRQQQRSYTQQYQSRQNQEQQQHRRHHQQHYYPQRDQQPPPPQQDVRRPNDTGNTLLNQVPTVLRPGPQQRQPPSAPNPTTDQKSSPMQRPSSVQLTPADAYSGCRSHSLDVPRSLHRENRQVSRGPPAPRASSHDVAGSHPQENQSRVTPHHGDVNRDPRRASVRSTSLDSGTRQSLHAGTSQPPAVMPFGPGSADTGQHTSLAVAPLRIRKGGGQSQAPGLEEPRPSAWAPAGQHMQLSQHAGQARPNLHGPRPQPQSNHRANGPQAIRMVAESPPGNDVAAAQPGQTEVRGRRLAPALAPSPSPSPALRFEDIDHPGVQRTSQTSSALRAVADGVLKHVSRERPNANAAVNFVLLPTHIFTHSQAVDTEGSNTRIFGVLYEDAGDEKKPWGPGSGLRYKHDSGVMFEGPNDAE
ncbi:hypothetical protein LY76DRAFT_653909 [Colletotrichum caudatum]|nr:hypothetical protein LY76DRAFT_653909 [Colletotrichum caudatum]